MNESVLRDDDFPNGCIYSEAQIREFFENEKSGEYPCWSCKHSPRFACIDIRLRKLDGTYVKNTRVGPENYYTR